MQPLSESAEGTRYLAVFTASVSRHDLGSGPYNLMAVGLTALTEQEPEVSSCLTTRIFPKCGLGCGEKVGRSTHTNLGQRPTTQHWFNSAVPRSLFVFKTFHRPSGVAKFMDSPDKPLILMESHVTNCNSLFDLQGALIDAVNADHESLCVLPIARI